MPIMDLKDILTKEDSDYQGLTLQAHMKELLFNYFESNGAVWDQNHFAKLSHDLKRNLKLQAPYVDPNSLEHTITLSSSLAKTGNEEHTFVCDLPNVHETFDVLSTLGKDITHIEKFAVERAITNLAKERDYLAVNMLGKIFTKKGFYFVLWADRKDISQTSLNAIDVFVSVDYLNWNKLPELKPCHIRRSRKVKKVMSGVLESTIDEILTEAEYLKANVLRLIYANRIVPSGLFMLTDGDDRSVAIDKEFTWENEKCLSVDNWVYRYPEILKSGDLTHNKFREELQEQLNEKDPMSARLKSVSESVQDIWSIKIHSEASIVSRKVNKELTSVQMSKAVITNRQWPGALNFFDEDTKKFGLVYFGYGLKKDQLVLPLKVRSVDVEPKFRDNKEFKEPNPDNDDDVLETDSEPEVEDD